LPEKAATEKAPAASPKTAATEKKPAASPEKGATKKAPAPSLDKAPSKKAPAASPKTAATKKAPGASLEKAATKKATAASHKTAATEKVPAASPEKMTSSASASAASPSAALPPVDCNPSPDPKTKPDTKPTPIAPAPGFCRDSEVKNEFVCGLHKRVEDEVVDEEDVPFLVEASDSDDDSDGTTSFDDYEDEWRAQLNCNRTDPNCFSKPPAPAHDTKALLDCVVLLPSPSVETKVILHICVNSLVTIY
jgi:hypothetical protein